METFEDVWISKHGSYIQRSQTIRILNGDKEEDCERNGASDFSMIFCVTL